MRHRDASTATMILAWADGFRLPQLMGTLGGEVASVLPQGLNPGDWRLLAAPTRFLGPAEGGERNSRRLVLARGRGRFLRLTRPKIPVDRREPDFDRISVEAEDQYPLKTQ